MEESVQVKYKAIRTPVVGFYHNILSIYESVRSVSSTEQRTGLILGMIRYLFQGGIKGVDKTLLEEFEKRGCIKGIIPEGGFMGPIELLKEEGRQEGLQKGRQEGQRELILKMLKEELDISLVSKVTGLSEEEIRKLKNGA